MYLQYFLKNENREQVLWMRKFLVTFKKVTELATFFGGKTVRLRRDNYFKLSIVLITISSSRKLIQKSNLK